VNPLTVIYGSLSKLRNSLFDRGVLARHRLQHPVVSVGNLSVGGAGKTPFVIALGGLLKERGLRFDVLSRGYGRKSRGVLAVDPAGSPAQFGDEPLLIARKLDVPVVVGESRYAAGVLAEKQFHTHLHILDDGFQHRSLARDLDIALVSESDFQDRLLPAGRLREPLSSLDRADLVVLPAGVEAAHPALRDKPICRMTRRLELKDLPSAPVVFCGIARPEEFFAQVRAAGVDPAAEIEFSDHHAYTPRDLAKLTALGSRFAANGFVTTEKDRINLGAMMDRLLPLSFAALRLEIADPDNIVDTIIERIRKRMPRS
jgi:tetraacyldisaccharide 4'-kinase